MESVSNCSNQKKRASEEDGAEGRINGTVLPCAVLLVLISALCLYDTARLLVPGMSAGSDFPEVPSGASVASTGAGEHALPFPGAALMWFQPMDINAVSMEELAQLPGIGEKRASDIVNFRMQRGFLITRDELELIYGFPADRFKKLSNYITTTPWNKIGN